MIQYKIYREYIRYIFKGEEWDVFEVAILNRSGRNDTSMEEEKRREIIY